MSARVGFARTMQGLLGTRSNRRVTGVPDPSVRLPIRIMSFVIRWSCPSKEEKRRGHSPLLVLAQVSRGRSRWSGDSAAWDTRLDTLALGVHPSPVWTPFAPQHGTSCSVLWCATLATVSAHCDWLTPCGPLSVLGARAPSARPLCFERWPKLPGADVRFHQSRVCTLEWVR